MPLFKVAQISAVCAIGILVYCKLSWLQGQTSNQADDAAISQERKDPQANRKREKKVYTNEDLYLLRDRRRINQSETPIVTKTKKDSKVDNPSLKRSESVSSLTSYRDVNGHDRAYWQGKVKSLRSKLDSLSSQIQSLQQRQNETNAASGIKLSRRGRLQTNSDNNRNTLSKRMVVLEQKRAEALRSIQELEEEARKAQALPEWLR